MANLNENLNGNETLALSHAAMTSNGPSVLTIILMVISAWIVLANTLVLLCLVVSRKALKIFVNLQILSFSVTDTLVGLAAIPTALTYKLAFTLSDVGPCALVLCSYSVAQAATLYHAFVICIHRLMTIKRCTGRSEANPRHMYKTLLIQVSIPWIESLLVVSLSFVLFAQFGKSLPVCSLNTVFEENYIHVMTILCINLLTPQIGMNVVYIYMLVFLLRQWKRVCILRKKARPTATTSNVVWNTSQAASVVETKLTTQTIGGKNSILTLTSVVDNEIDGKINEGKENSDHCVTGHDVKGRVHGNRKEWSRVCADDKTDCHSNDKSGDGSHILKNNTNFRENVATDHTRRMRGQHQKMKSKAGKLGISGQRDVVITIGLMLIILNVFMTPLTFLAIVES